MKRWSAGGRLKRTSPSGPISDAPIIEFRTNTSWLSKLSTIDRDSTRSSAKPPISSKGAIHSAAMMIMRRVSEPVRRRCALVGRALPAPG